MQPRATTPGTALLAAPSHATTSRAWGQLWAGHTIRIGSALLPLPSTGAGEWSADCGVHCSVVELIWAMVQPVALHCIGPCRPSTDRAETGWLRVAAWVRPVRFAARPLATPQLASLPSQPCVARPPHPCPSYACPFGAVRVWCCRLEWGHRCPLLALVSSLLRLTLACRLLQGGCLVGEEVERRTKWMQVRAEARLYRPQPSMHSTSTSAWKVLERRAGKVLECSRWG